MIVLLIQLSEKIRVLSPIWSHCSTTRFLCRGNHLRVSHCLSMVIEFPNPLFHYVLTGAQEFFYEKGLLADRSISTEKEFQTFGKSETSDTKKWAQLHHVSHQFYQTETAQSILHNSNWQGTIVRGSVTKYIFAKFRRIFPKLSSKIMVGVVLTEKDCWEELNFGLDRSDVDFSQKNFAWTKRCAHALRRIRYLIVLWNEKLCKSEIW